jgi:hypothetical protein
MREFGKACRKWFWAVLPDQDGLIELDGMGFFRIKRGHLHTRQRSLLGAKAITPGIFLEIAWAFPTLLILARVLLI